MRTESRLPYQLYQEEMVARLGRLDGGKHPAALDVPARWLADAITALQVAVGDRLTGRDGGGRRPLATLHELHEVAAKAALPPDGRRVEISMRQLRQILRLPALDGERLGPFHTAAVRALGRAVVELGLVPPTVLYPVVRTVEFDEIGRIGPEEHMLSFVAGGHGGNGIGMMLATCVERDAGTAADVADQVDRRLRYLAALRAELAAVMDHDLLVLLRGERRHADEAEGTSTAEAVWCVGEQDGWTARLDHWLPSAIALAEVSPEWLRGLEYALDRRSRRIGWPQAFLSSLEWRNPAVGAWTLLMTELDDERELAGADDVVVSDACIVSRSGERFALVMPVSWSASTIYAIPYERAEQLGDDGWDLIRRGLAAVHGEAVARSSDDQGRALTLPHRHALSLVSDEADSASNMDVLRAFSHAVEATSHWHAGGPAPQRPSRGDEAERRAA